MKAIIASLTAAFLVGCGLLNPIQVAETAEQKFYAAKLTYEVILKPVVAIIEDEQAPIEIRRLGQEAVSASAQAFEDANTAFTQFTVAKAQFAVGEITDEQLTDIGTNFELRTKELQDNTTDLAKVLAK